MALEAGIVGFLWWVCPYGDCLGQVLVALGHRSLQGKGLQDLVLNIFVHLWYNFSSFLYLKQCRRNIIIIIIISDRNLCSAVHILSIQLQLVLCPLYICTGKYQLSRLLVGEVIHYTYKVANLHTLHNCFTTQITRTSEDLPSNRYSVFKNIVCFP